MGSIQKYNFVDCYNHDAAAQAIDGMRDTPTNTSDSYVSVRTETGDVYEGYVSRNAARVLTEAVVDDRFGKGAGVSSNSRGGKDYFDSQNVAYGQSASANRRVMTDWERRKEYDDGYEKYRNTWGL